MTNQPPRNYTRVAAAIIIAGLVVAAAILASSYSRTSAPTVTVTATASDAYDKVSSSFANHLLMFGSRNVPSLVDEYESNATVYWNGHTNGKQPPGLEDTAVGAHNITQFLNYVLVQSFSTFFLTNQTSSLSAVENKYRVNSTFDFVAINSDLRINSGLSNYRNVTGTVSAQVSYVNVGNSWLISYEC